MTKEQREKLLYQPKNGYDRLSFICRQRYIILRKKTVGGIKIIVKFI